MSDKDGADGTQDIENPAPEAGPDPSGQDAHNPETEEDTASGGPA
jgi:hypothetical protein